MNGQHDFHISLLYGANEHQQTNIESCAIGSGSVDVVTNSYVVGGSVHVIYGRTLGNSDYPNLDVDVG